MFFFFFNFDKDNQQEQESQALEPEATTPSKTAKNTKPKESAPALPAIDDQNIKNLIYTIRGKQVMLDSDLAKLYGYEVKYLNRQVKRNIRKFPALRPC